MRKRIEIDKTQTTSIVEVPIEGTIFVHIGPSLMALGSLFSAFALAIHLQLLVLF